LSIEEAIDTQVVSLIDPRQTAFVSLGSSAPVYFDNLFIVARTLNLNYYGTSTVNKKNYKQILNGESDAVIQLLNVSRNVHIELFADQFKTISKFHPFINVLGDFTLVVHVPQSVIYLRGSFGGNINIEVAEGGSIGNLDIGGEFPISALHW